MATKASKQLETFPNPHSDRDYIIEITAPEFTCLCPKTGQPDFATVYLEYVPDKLCVELKSLKLYIWSYREEGHFHEDVTNRILMDLVAATKPRYMRLRMEFYVRGGVYTDVEVEHRKGGWQPLPMIPELPRHQVTEKGAPAATEAQADGRGEERTERFRMLQRTRRSGTETGGARAKTPTPAPTPAAPTPPPAPVVAAPPPPPPAPPKPPKNIYVGIDVGTTGCRACAIDAHGEVLAEAQAPIGPPTRSGKQISQDPTNWWKAATNTLQALLAQVNPQQIHSIAVAGTSGTILFIDEKGAPVTPAILYNDQRATEEADLIAGVAEPSNGAHGASSALAKLLWLQNHKLDARARHALHQADWIAGRLCGQWGHSDYANSLKLGFDQERLAWPSWMKQIGVNPSFLPTVHMPGETLGPVSAEAVKQFNLDPETLVVAGTTDGVAAFLATGANAPGHGVTSLGSTLVLKLLSTKPAFSPEHGVYSHRLGKYWLAGGASNSGGAVLLQYFKTQQMREMTPLIDPEHFTELNYYPLPDIGERFPINDPGLEPKLEPLPADSVTFFQGMLEGIARIEAMGYDLLKQLGAPPLTDVWTTGGGAQNTAWTRIRERVLHVKARNAKSGFSAYGAALLASGVVAKKFQ
jgi:7-cyano-7-deazaguanine reductase